MTYWLQRSSAGGTGHLSLPHLAKSALKGPNLHNALLQRVLNSQPTNLEHKQRPQPVILQNHSSELGRPPPHAMHHTRCNTSLFIVLFNFFAGLLGTKDSHVNPDPSKIRYCHINFCGVFLFVLLYFSSSQIYLVLSPAQLTWTTKTKWNLFLFSGVQQPSSWVLSSPPTNI